MREVLLTA
jgi:hypothetical protein